MRFFSPHSGYVHPRAGRQVAPPLLPACLQSRRRICGERVYITELSLKEEERAKRMLSAMFDYFQSDKDKLPPFYLRLSEIYPLEQAICDYLSSMTDKFAVAVFNSIFIPKSWALREEDIEM